MVTATRNIESETAVAIVRRTILDQLNALPKTVRTDLHEVCRLFATEEDEAERHQIARTLTEMLFPEAARVHIELETLDDMVAARKRLVEYRVRVGHHIRKRREELGMTQEQLADEAGIPQSHVSRLERGKHAPTHLTIERLAAALRSSPAELAPAFDG